MIRAQRHGIPRISWGFSMEGDKIFVYGQQVDDFVFLKKDAIWTVATSALQEVDRKVTALEARISALENN